MFDVSDVINYFRSARLPTGIQRVQIEVVEHAVRDGSFDFSIACFTKETNYWIEIPRELFVRLCTLSVGDDAEGDWDAILESLESAIVAGKPFEFVRGSILFNLGSSWWLQNYFLGVRYAKAKFGILYVPFIHDLIPMAMPELCVAELRNNFEEWIDSVFHHADYFLVNSRNTEADLTIAARRADAERETAVITLDADFRTAPSVSADNDIDFEAALKQWDIERGRFALFVSTIEPRKNHALVFTAWLKLLRRHGAKNCPKLVCVGQRGWLNSEAHARLAASEELRSKIVILSDVSDAALGKLYETCICTLYPSLYEGWGLPVTESLCFGKVPIISHVASLPEAGGAFAEYFDVSSERALLESLERVVFDEDYRLARERKIADEFRPRSWQEIGAQIVSQLRRWSEAHAKPGPRDGNAHAAIANTGAFHSLAGEIQNARGEDAKRGEIFRAGRHWWWAEPWGCWIREKGPASLSFCVENASNTQLFVYLGLKGVQGLDGTGIIHTSDGQRIAVALRSEEDKIVTIALAPSAEQKRQVMLTFTCDVVADFRPGTKGIDFRICGLGVKWFYVCRADDVEARMSFVNTILMQKSAKCEPEPAPKTVKAKPGSAKRRR